MANSIATNCDHRDRKALADRAADDQVKVDDREKVADDPAEADRAEALRIACWPSTKTKTAKSRKKKLRNS